MKKLWWVDRYSQEKQQEVFVEVADLMLKWLDNYQRTIYTKSIQTLLSKFFWRCDRNDLHDEFLEFAAPVKAKRLENFDKAFAKSIDDWIFWWGKDFVYYIVRDNIMVVMERSTDPSRKIEKKSEVCYPKWTERAIKKEEYPITWSYVIWSEIERIYPRRKVYDFSN